jgi:tRNA1Val (adenine37-N6)-methyltransferase
MPQPFFRFKQFTVHQSDAVLKVSTEACILGAWATAPDGATRLLDVGTGTGLLALMLAQRHPQALIDAVELAEAAARQATENVANSPFADRIRVHQTAIQEFSIFNSQFSIFNGNGYDFIVANPPFYQHNLRSPDLARNAAKHAETLSFTDLLTAVRRLLAPTGAFVVLLPPVETEVFLRKAAESGLFLHRQLRVRHRPGGRLFRLVSELRFSEKEPDVEELSIHAPEGGYAPEFVALLKDFYLNF